MSPTQRPALPVPKSEAEVAFERAAHKAREASERLIRAIRQRPSTTIALAELVAAQAELEIARKAVNTPVRQAPEVKEDQS